MSLPLRTLPLLVVILTGCRPANPLDWKVSARTPAKFEAWCDANLARLPAREHTEFDRAFNFFASAAPRALAPANMDNSGNAICDRMNGRTVRQVILEGYDLEMRLIAARISTESDNIVRNANQTAKIDDEATLQRFEKARLAQAASIEQMNTRLEEIRRRVRELTTTGVPTP